MAGHESHEERLDSVVRERAQLEQELAKVTQERDTLRTQCDGLQLQLRRLRELDSDALAKMREEVLRERRALDAAAYDHKRNVTAWNEQEATKALKLELDTAMAALGAIERMPPPQRLSAHRARKLAARIVKMSGKLLEEVG